MRLWVSETNNDSRGTRPRVSSTDIINVIKSCPNNPREVGTIWTITIYYYLKLETILYDPRMMFCSHLAGRRSRTRTTWSCTVLSRTWTPWGAGVGWASSAGTPGCQWGARFQLCMPTATGQRVPGRQTCPPCAQPCAAELPRNNPCSAWWSPRRSLDPAWWSGQRVPHQLAARSTGSVKTRALLFKEKQQHIWSLQTIQTRQFQDFETSCLMVSKQEFHFHFESFFFFYLLDTVSGIWGSSEAQFIM